MRVISAVRNDARRVAQQSTTRRPASVRKNVVSGPSCAYVSAPLTRSTVPSLVCTS
jgi:hypothetical protein